LKLKLQSSADNAIQIQIDKEDYSIADIVHRELLNVKHVKFAGVPPPHPLIKTLTIQLQTDGADPRKVLGEALELSQSRIKDLLKLGLETFPQLPKNAGELRDVGDAAVRLTSSSVEALGKNIEGTPGHSSIVEGGHGSEADSNA